MTDTPWILGDNSAAGLTAQLGEEWDTLIELGQGLSDDDWSAPTSCPGWSVGAQYAHIIGTESSLLGLPAPDWDPGSPAHVKNPVGKGNEVWVGSIGGLSKQEVLDRFAEVTSQRREVLAKMGEEEFSAPSWTPIGDADYRRFMQLRVFDCWVHEQDIRDGIDRQGHQTGPVVEQSLDEVFRSIGYIVGKRAGAPEGTTLRIRLTGPATRDVLVAVKNGRAGAVASLPEEPQETVALSSNAFIRLACGRIDPEEVLEGALGGVSFDGEVGRSVATHLAYTM